MGIRIIAREARLQAALECLTQTRSRSKQFPSTTLERQPRDHRVSKRDSTKPAAVIASVAALSRGEGVAGATMAAGGSGYYSGGSGGGFGGGGEQN